MPPSSFLNLCSKTNVTVTRTFQSRSASFLSLSTANLPAAAAGTHKHPWVTDSKAPLIQTGHPRVQSPQHSCPLDVCPAILGVRQATLNSSPPDNPAEKDEDETRLEFYYFFFLTDGAAGYKPFTHTQEPDSEAETAVQPKITRWLSKRGHKSLDGGVDANMMIKSVVILIDGLIRWDKWDLISLWCFIFPKQRPLTDVSFLFFFVFISPLAHDALLTFV